MTSRAITSTVLMSIALVCFPTLKSPQRIFSVEDTVKKYMSDGNYAIAQSTAYSVGGFLTLARGRVTRHPAKCLAGIRPVQDDFGLPAQDYVIWERGVIDRLKRYIGEFEIDLSVTTSKDEKHPQAESHVKAKVTPSEGADKLTVSISFTGRREEAHQQTLNAYATSSEWSRQCLEAVKAKSTYVIVAVIHGLIRVRVFEQFGSDFKAREFPMPAGWTMITEGKVIEYEREATLILASHPKIKTRGSTVTEMKLMSYLKEQSGL